MVLGTWHALFSLSLLLYGWGRCRRRNVKEGGGNETHNVPFERFDATRQAAFFNCLLQDRQHFFMACTTRTFHGPQPHQTQDTSPIFSCAFPTASSILDAARSIKTHDTHCHTPHMHRHHASELHLLNITRRNPGVESRKQEHRTEMPQVCGEHDEVFPDVRGQKNCSVV